MTENPQQRAEHEACALRSFLHSTEFQGLLAAAHNQKASLSPAVRSDILKSEKWILDRLETICDS